MPPQPHDEALPGIPTARPFKALACGIPLISAPWEDAENLFRPGAAYLVARDRREMQGLLREVPHDPGLAMQLRTNGLERIATPHTCAHRVDELLKIFGLLGAGAGVAA